jgi:MFS family permease
VFVLALVAGVLQTFEMPARQSFLQDIVGREDLSSAIALNSALVNGARIVGPALAGALVAQAGEGACFSINGMCYLAIIGGFLAMRLPPQTTTVSSPTTGSTAAFIREGLAYAIHAPVIRLLLVLIGLISTGAVVGSILLARHQGINKLGRTIAFALVRFGIGLILFSLSRNLWLSVLLLPLVGSGFMVPMSAANTLLQTLTPDHLRGRIMSLFLMTFMGTPPLGSLLTGFLASHIGAPLTVGLTGVCCLGAAVWFALRMPLLQEAEEATDLLATEQHALGK